LLLALEVYLVYLESVGTLNLLKGIMKTINQFNEGLRVLIDCEE